MDEIRSSVVGAGGIDGKGIKPSYFDLKVLGSIPSSDHSKEA